MGYWGWRPLVVCAFISVWVVGCNIVTESAPSLSPTPSPRVTLTVRQIAPPTGTASPSPVGDVALRFGVDVNSLEAANPRLDPGALQPGQTLVIPPAPGGTSTPTATPPALTLAPPTCYETPVDGILCLGAVDNSLDHAIEQVQLLVQIVRADGGVIADQTVDVEQALIPAGQFAPYRAVFDASPRDFSRARAQLQRADPAPVPDTRFVPVSVENQSGHEENGRFVITASLHNQGIQAAQAIRLVATLRDAAGRVIGYRVMRAADSLAAGESIPMRVEIVPQIADAQPTYTLYVEARAEMPSLPTPTH